MFALPGKKPEEALFFYTNDFFVVVFVELKSELQRKTIRDLKAKFKAGLEKILSLLPVYHHGEAYHEIQPLYVGLTVYRSIKSGIINSIENDSTNTDELLSTFAEAMQQEDTSSPVEKRIEPAFLGRHKIHYTFYQEDQEEIEYSIKRLLEMLSVDTDNMSTCPNSK